MKAATWDEDGHAWDIALEDGARFSARYLVTAVGPLSAPTLPEYREWCDRVAAGGYRELELA